MVFELRVLGADIATVGFAAFGVTAPIAIAARGLGYIAEGVLFVVNTADGFIKGNWGA